MDIVISKAGVPVRLTEERWFHIVENHDDLAGYYDQVLEISYARDKLLERSEAIERLERLERSVPMIQGAKAKGRVYYHRLLYLRSA